MVCCNSLWLSWNGDYWHSALGSAPCPVEPGWPLKDGGVQWLISWPGMTTTPPLARAYGAACPMDSCVCNTHPHCMCALSVCKRESSLVILYWSFQLHVLPKQCCSSSCCAAVPLRCTVTKFRILNVADWICYKHTHMHLWYSMDLIQLNPLLTKEQRNVI